MSLVISIAIAILYLDQPWKTLLIVGAFLFEGFELWLFLKWRGVPPISGAESFVGAVGRTTQPCTPTGRASIRGQSWRVTSDRPCPSHTRVRVTAVEGTFLRVTPEEDPNAAR